MLHIRLYYDGVRECDYASGVKVPIEHWPEMPADHPQARITRLRLAKIRADHDQILLNMEIAGLVPTALAIKTAWIGDRTERPKSAPLTVASLFKSYVDELELKTGDQKRAEVTIIAYRYTQRFLGEFLTASKQLRIPAEALPVSFANNFYDFARLRVKSITAGKLIIQLKAAMKNAKRTGKIEQFDWRDLRLKRDPAKPIHYLSPVQLIELALIPVEPVAIPSRDWALLMCYTGLDYRDAQEVVTNLGKYYRTGPHGETIVYQRMKGKAGASAPRWGQCEIPILPETRELLTSALDWKRPLLRNLNGFLNDFGDRMKLDFSFSSKICRHTAGTVMLMRYRDIHVVQKVLGHQSVTMTERWYTDILPQYVHQAMLRNPY